jgi:hypothetical protein
MSNVEPGSSNHEMKEMIGERQMARVEVQSLERISKPKSGANITFGVRVTNITSLWGGRTQ